MSSETTDALRPSKRLPALGWPPDGWPPNVWQVPYDPHAVPGSDQSGSWLLRANCQRFAYGVLGLFGRCCPPLRSAELWSDRHSTFIVSGEPQPLDLVLFNATCDPFGAHVGLWMADDSILHLCREVGVPTAWPRQNFGRRPRYASLIGFKRVRNTERDDRSPPG